VCDPPLFRTCVRGYSMAIIVSCSCGKRFKAKDELAGKKVRCPGCKNPVTVEGKAAKSKSSGGASKADIEAAMAKYEAAQAVKAKSAEDEARFKEEANKLIESYDALAGKTEKNSTKKKKGQLAESDKPKKPTVVTHAADAGGTVAQNPWVRYLVIAGLLIGAAAAAQYGVGLLVGYANSEVTPNEKPEVALKRLEKEAREAIFSNQFDVAEAKLSEMLEIDPARKEHRNYKAISSDLERRRDRES